MKSNLKTYVAILLLGGLVSSLGRGATPPSYAGNYQRIDSNGNTVCSAKLNCNGFDWTLHRLCQLTVIDSTSNTYQETSIQVRLLVATPRELTIGSNDLSFEFGIGWVKLYSSGSVESRRDGTFDIRLARELRESGENYDRKFCLGATKVE